MVSRSEKIVSDPQHLMVRNSDAFILSLSYTVPYVLKVGATQNLILHCVKSIIVAYFYFYSKSKRTTVRHQITPQVWAIRFLPLDYVFLQLELFLKVLDSF
jgi:hypothetical protein